MESGQVVELFLKVEVEGWGRVLGRGSVWMRDWEARRGTDEDAEVDGAAEGVVALDESVQGPACQRDPGEVFGVDVAEYVVEQLRREVCQSSHCAG